MSIETKCVRIIELDDLDILRGLIIQKYRVHCPYMSDVEEEYCNRVNILNPTLTEVDNELYVVYKTEVRGEEF